MTSQHLAIGCLLLFRHVMDIADLEKQNNLKFECMIEQLEEI
jgi:hypothetical protein